jgi:hypothetical protein
VLSLWVCIVVVEEAFRRSLELLELFFDCVGDLKYAIKSLRCVKVSWGKIGSEYPLKGGEIRVFILFESDSGDVMFILFSKIEVCHGRIDPSRPSSPAEAFRVRAEAGITPREARIARARLERGLPLLLCQANAVHKLSGLNES